MEYELTFIIVSSLVVPSTRQIECYKILMEIIIYIFTVKILRYEIFQID